MNASDHPREGKGGEVRAGTLSFWMRHHVAMGGAGGSGRRGVRREGGRDVEQGEY